MFTLLKICVSWRFPLCLNLHNLLFFYLIIYEFIINLFSKVVINLRYLSQFESIIIIFKLKMILMWFFWIISLLKLLLFLVATNRCFHHNFRLRKFIFFRWSSFSISCLKLYISNIYKAKLRQLTSKWNIRCCFILIQFLLLSRSDLFCNSSLLEVISGARILIIIETEQILKFLF